MQSGDFGGIEIIQGRIDMPAVESRDTLSFIFERNSRFVKGGVTRMFQPTFGETFVVVNNTIADKLHLGNRGDSLEIRMKNGFLSLASLVVSVTIAFAMRIKRLENCYHQVQINVDVKCLCNGVLLSGRNCYISKEKCTVLGTHQFGGKRHSSHTYGVQRRFDFLEQFCTGVDVCQIDSFDFTAKVAELGNISRLREREGKELDSHGTGARSEACRPELVCYLLLLLHRVKTCSQTVGRIHISQHVLHGHKV